MALGVGAARDRQADEVHRRRRLRAVGPPAEHHGADLAAADAALAVERDGEGLPRVGQRLDVGQHGSRVEVDGVPAERLHERHVGPVERLAEVRRRGDPVAEVVLLHDLPQALRDRLQVSAGEAAVRREALGQDQEVAALLGQVVVVEREPATDVREAVLLCRHRHPVGEAGHVAHDVGDRAIALARLAQLDEPGVLGEPASIEEERHPMLVAHLADRAQVRERDWLAAARVVGHGDEDDGHAAASLVEEAVERVHVHVALERMDRRRVAALLDHEIDRLGAGGLDVRPGRVEVGVVGHRLARPAEDAEQDLLGRPALVGGDHVPEREELRDGIKEGVPRG